MAADQIRAPRLITFLGTGEYQETLYRFGDLTHKTRLVQTAVCRFFDPSDLLVFVTGKARTKWLGDLEREMRAQGVPVRAIDIPDGQNDAELWQIFDAMTGALEPGDRIIFDITHAFRAIPVLTFLAATFLRETLGVTVERVVYGAYAGAPRLADGIAPGTRPVEERQPGETPLLDLSAFLELMDWTMAARTFRNTGDGRDLAECIRSRSKTLYRQTGQSQTAMKRCATAIENYSAAYMLARPDDTAAASQHLRSALADVETRIAGILPLRELLKKLSEHANVAPSINGPLEVLWTEHRLLQLYIANQQPMQAFALAREWLISVACHILGIDPGSSRSVRDGVAAWLSSSIPREADDDAPARAPISEAPVPEPLRAAWGSVQTIRNTLAHCGKGTVRPPKVQTILDATRELGALLDAAAVCLKETH